MKARDQLLTCAEFGRKLTPPLTPAAVRAAERAGRIKAALRTESGLRLFTLAELERVLTHEVLAELRYCQGVEAA